MSAEVPEGASAEEQKEMEDKVTSPEKAEEAKLKARYPHLGQKPGGSDFLRKRLQKGQKYFDSGDYNMAKAKMKNKQLPTAAPDKTEVTAAVEANILIQLCSVRIPFVVEDVNEVCMCIDC
ncbi:cAMP-regulated phosphoprotein 19 [Camelus dromedarius]|uniref:cAMP-regulated phosphoprotein 19 n=1 Tax=Camelus dromedarius TaxID=9838 RepID=A0A5N4DLY1_CAMDR|nr:cAMP-regulated phosphoprotein 19 [Camelus dromedarius]